MKMSETCYDLIDFVAESDGNMLPGQNFHSFAYRGLVWNLQFTDFSPGPLKGDLSLMDRGCT